MEELEIVDTERPIIKVIGVGGGGGNAANYMFKKGITDVDFVVCNTDKKALNASPIPTQVLLSDKGLGAGSKPEIGRQAAIEHLPEITEILKDSTEMVFVTAGMGGGTGTGAAPVIARAAKDMGILTVGIVTIPFLFEGRKRVQQALEGLQEMRKSVDAIIIITNERIKELYGDLTMSKAFNMADNVLATAAKGIAELITVTGYVNVDLEDVRTVMTNSGDAIMGSAIARGEDRAITAIQEALNSPLLINNDITQAKSILLNITSGVDENEATMGETSIITNYLEELRGGESNMIWGNTQDPELGDALQVTIVVAGLNLTDEEISKPSEPAKKSATSFVTDLFHPAPKPAETKSDSHKMTDDEFEKISAQAYGKNPFTKVPKQEDQPLPPYSPEVDDPENKAKTFSFEPSSVESAQASVQENPKPQEPEKPAEQPKKYNLSDLKNMTDDNDF